MQRGEKTVTNGGLFSQLLAQFPREEFKAFAAKHQAKRHAKGFTCYIQFVAMLFCHLARAEPLRQIVHGLHSCGRKRKHLRSSWLRPIPRWLMPMPTARLSCTATCSSPR